MSRNFMLAEKCNSTVPTPCHGEILDSVGSSDSEFYFFLCNNMQITLFIMLAFSYPLSSCQAEKEETDEQNKPEFLKVSLKKTAQSQAC